MLPSHPKLYSLVYYKSRNHGLKIVTHVSNYIPLYTCLSRPPHDLNREPGDSTVLCVLQASA